MQRLFITSYESVQFIQTTALIKKIEILLGSIHYISHLVLGNLHMTSTQ